MARPFGIRALGVVLARWQRIMRKVRKRYWSVIAAAKVADCGRVTANRRIDITGGGKVVLGDNVHFNGMRINGAGGVRIGNNFHSGVDCVVLSVNHDFDGGEAIPYGRKVIEGPVVIGDNVWFGDRVIVLPGAVIGEGAIIGAGSVVTGEIEPCAVAVGVPAKRIRFRDVEHYDQLKAEGKFW